MNMILRNKMCNKYTDFKNPQSKILKVNRIFHWSLAISIDVKQYSTRVRLRNRTVVIFPVEGCSWPVKCKTLRLTDFTLIIKKLIIKTIIVIFKFVLIDI